MSDIKNLTEQILEFREAREWSQFHKPKDMLISLFCETSELAEHFKWKTDKEIQGYVEENRDEISEELSDILYWTLLISHDLGVNLKEAFARKMKINEAKYPVEKARGNHAKYSELS